MDEFSMTSNEFGMSDKSKQKKILTMYKVIIKQVTKIVATCFAGLIKSSIFVVHP
jgi:hypothetical protein